MLERKLPPNAARSPSCSTAKGSLGDLEVAPAGHAALSLTRCAFCADTPIWGERTGSTGLLGYIPRQVTSIECLRLAVLRSPVLELNLPHP